MDRFSSAREAKEFLVSTIVDEAQRENMPLSDLERKMLYFSENYSSLPDIMEISDEFDRTYDLGEYENKIARLIRALVRGFTKRATKNTKSGGTQFGFLRKKTITYL